MPSFLGALLGALACVASLTTLAQPAAPPESTTRPTGLASMTPGASREAPSLADDPALEARVLKVADELRCLVCQNETIAASRAGLAVDLRNQIRIKLGEGQSERQILDFMVERYGDFVLYRPPLKATTVLLWAGPFALLLAAAGVMALNIRKRRQGSVSTDLSAAEAKRVGDLLGEQARPP